MIYHDISSALHANHPIWPGDPAIEIEWISRIEDGAESNISALQLGVHTATHVDAPLHFLENGKTVDNLPFDQLIGEVCVLQIPDDQDSITARVLSAFDLTHKKKVLFKTRNSTLKLLQNSEFEPDYVALDVSGAQWLVDHGVELVGIDYLSIAEFKDTFLPHLILLKANVIVVEGLNLTDVEVGRYKLICLPLKLAGREGAPARVILEELDK